MSTIRYILRSINVLNLSLAATAVIFFIYFLNPLLCAPVSEKVPSPKDISDGRAANAVAAMKKPSLSDYSLIAEQNLFHPDRVVPAEKKPVAVAPRPELVLYGTLITSGAKFAYLEDRKATPTPAGQVARQIALKEGDTVSGYTLKQIEENLIVLSNGEEQMTLYLDELKNRKGEITGTGKTQAAATPQTSQPPQRTPTTLQPPPIQPPPLMEPASRPPSQRISSEQQKPIAMPPFPPLPETSMPSSQASPAMKQP